MVLVRGQTHSGLNPAHLQLRQPLDGKISKRNDNTNRRIAEMKIKHARSAILRTTLAFVLISISACPQAVIGQSTEINLDRLNLGKTSWDGLYMGGQKSGYLSSTYEKRQKDGREVIVFHQSFVVQVVVMDDPWKTLNTLWAKRPASNCTTGPTRKLGTRSRFASLISKN